MDNITRRQFNLLLLELVALAYLPGCLKHAPVFGKEAVQAPLVIEDHGDALMHWAKQGVADAILVNIDKHDDFRFIADGKIEELRQIYRKKEWQSFANAGKGGDGSLYGIGNWIYAGARLGVFREAYWVVPFDCFSRENAEVFLRGFLEIIHFSDEDIRTFHLLDNRFCGIFRGIKVTICGIESLPDISSPLLLSFCMDFFPAFSDAYRVSYLTAFSHTFEALYRKKYQIQDAVVSYSVNGDYYLQPHHRWLGDAVVKILGNPEMIRTPPTELLTLLQQIENDYRSVDGEGMLQLVDGHLVAYPTAALFLYKAYAHLLLGNSEKSYLAAIECCRIDRLYSTALPFMGIMYYTKGNYTVAEKFFRAGVANNPQMSNGLFQFGHCLRKTGKLREALLVYEKDAFLQGAFPTQFLVAETHIFLNDPAAALKALNTAMTALKKNIYAQVENSETAQAMYSLIEFCNKAGFAENATAMLENPVIRKMFTIYPKRLKGSTLMP